MKRMARPDPVPGSVRHRPGLRVARCGQAALPPVAAASAAATVPYLHRPRSPWAATDEESITMTQSPSMIVQAEFTTAPPTTAADRAWIRPWLRAEGLAVLGAGLAGFLFLGLPLWAFLLLLIVPDVSMIGYVRGPRVGAIVYNVAHDLVTGVALTGL